MNFFLEREPCIVGSLVSSHCLCSLDHFGEIIDSIWTPKQAPGVVHHTCVSICMRRYLDNLHDMKEEVQNTEDVTFMSELDRVYLGAPNMIEVSIGGG